MQTELIGYLLKASFIDDALGNQIESFEKKQVYLKLSSITQNEFFNAQTSGFKPEYKAIVFTYDYDGQDKVEINETIYNVYRTYENGDQIELYLETSIG